MATDVNRPSGLRIKLPETYRIADIAPPTARPTRRPSALPTGPIPIPTGPSPRTPADVSLIEALESQDMRVVDSFQFEPQIEPTLPSGQRREGAPPIPPQESFELETDLKPNEDAVLLLEQDGVYSWNFPSDVESLPQAATRRGMEPARGRATFRFDVQSVRRPTPPDKRGLITDFIYDKVQAVVLKFAARILVGQAMKYLEKHVQKGIVLIDSFDPTKWKRVDDISSVQLPADRPARILLFLHGTFSSTAGSYAALCATPWGREFLKSLWANYDAVIGYDHPTLSEDPLENATDLLQRLQGVQWKRVPHFDVITFSRGGLVYRSLVEHLLPASAWQVEFGEVVFVGATNGGTALAEPDNWQRLIDLYTNLAVASCRALSLMPQAVPVATVIKELIQGLGSLVKYMATRAVTERGVPGLAAMEPDGEFIKKINEIQPGQPEASKSYYCAITADFEPRIVDGEHEPRELPRRLVMALADGFVDQLMGEANDLVVNVSSVTTIDPQVPGFIKDRLDFGRTPDVYHLNYFVRPEVVNALARWLRLSKPTVAEVAEVRFRKLPAERRKKRGGPRRAGVAAAPPPDTIKMGAIVRRQVPAAADTDILVVGAKAAVREVRDGIKHKTPSYVVVRRHHYGETLDYAFKAEEVLSETESDGLDDLLEDALQLHEHDASSRKSTTELVAGETLGAGGERRPTSRRSVLMEGDQPVGVVAGADEFPKSIDLAKMAHRVSKPRDDSDRILARRAMPTFAEPEKAATAKPAKVECHFRAEMDDEVAMGRVTTVAVTVSREVIGRVARAAVATSEGITVDPQRKLILQAIPKANFEIVGESRVELDPPDPGKPQDCYFDVKPTSPGDGEIWVVARQGQIPLLTLALKARIVEVTSRAPSRAVVVGRAEEPPPLSVLLNQLTIFEKQNGPNGTFLYELDCHGLGIFDKYESNPIIGDRQQYVDNLYKQIEDRWISNKQDVDAFSEDLRAFGGSLFDDLFPDKLQRVLWENRDKIDSIMVISTEPFIPWELVHLKEPGGTLPPEPIFFGQKGLVRWLHGSWPPEKLRIQKGNARYVIPRYPDLRYKLEEAEEEAQFLEETFKASPVKPQVNAVRTLISQPGAFDLLHFACHGAAEHIDIANARLMMEGRIENSNYIPEFLLATTVDQFGKLEAPDGNRPLVVLNACQTGRAGYKLTGIGGFAQAFLKARAGAFVATLWSVGDSPARTFTETLYSELSKKRNNLASATTSAREAARKAGDATWLAYAVYGHPLARLTIKA